MVFINNYLSICSYMIILNVHGTRIIHRSQKHTLRTREGQTLMTKSYLPITQIQESVLHTELFS